MQTFREVKVWEKAHRLCLHVHQSTGEYPEDERQGLAAQTRRVSVYVPAKIAEGCGRGADKDLVRFLESARGYAAELEYLLLIGRDLGHLAPETADTLGEEVVEVQKMLYGFVRSVKARMNGEPSAKSGRAEREENLAVELA